VRIRFLTSTPLDIRRGSGTYVGIHVLARALEKLGHRVEYETAKIELPVYTAQRLLFNRRLRPSTEFDLTVGFDMDGYRIAAGQPGHVASLKGVIADEVRFESGFTRITMGIQARCEREHVRSAARVIATSRYSAERAREFYGLREAPAVVPELIELGEWRKALDNTAGQAAQPTVLTVLYVGRMYRRKRVDVLLRAASMLRGRVRVRIVGNGPCASAWRKLSEDLRLGDSVTWLGDVSRKELAAEYRGADVVCLPSVQEGFGIVLLEAMAAGTPIVAARAAAIPEVVPHGVLVEPDRPEALAAAIEELAGDPARRAELARTGSAWVEQFDAPRVAGLFLQAAGAAAIGKTA
jgi:glycosyltransferase involved in cell wall biosynthesis